MLYSVRVGEACQESGLSEASSQFVETYPLSLLRGLRVWDIFTATPLPQVLLSRPPFMLAAVRPVYEAMKSATSYDLSKRLSPVTVTQTEFYEVFRTFGRVLVLFDVFWQLNGFFCSAESALVPQELLNGVARSLYKCRKSASPCTVCDRRFQGPNLKFSSLCANTPRHARNASSYLLL